MRLYTMTMTINPDHRKHSSWKFSQYWNIEKVSQLNKIIKTLNSWTKYDKQGRVLCVGFPVKDMALQKRVYVVKWGHDNALWNQRCEYYDELVSKLLPTKVE